MIPKARLDALTDGIFAFAMTLLVLDLRLPDGFAAASAGDLLHALSSLSGQLVAYVISFAVLGARWLGQIRSRAPETVSGSYARWSLVYLFFITCMPFSTWSSALWRPRSGSLALCREHCRLDRCDAAARLAQRRAGSRGRRRSLSSLPGGAVPRLGAALGRDQPLRPRRRHVGLPPQRPAVGEVATPPRSGGGLKRASAGDARRPGAAAWLWRARRPARQPVARRREKAPRRRAMRRA